VFHSNQSKTADKYTPKQIGNLVFTSYFAVLKTLTNSNRYIYSVLTIPHFKGKKAVEVNSLPKLFALGEDGTYIEWAQKPYDNDCNLGNYTVCRNPPVIHSHIQNECLEQIVAGKGVKSCFTKPSSSISPYVERILPGTLAISTNTQITCVLNNKEWLQIKMVVLVHLGCKETILCEHNITHNGEKFCPDHDIKPYVLKTRSYDITKVSNRVKQMNISMPKLYPHLGAMDLLDSLEEQIGSQQQNMLNWNIGK
ncbi:unnamed protein product, partial [Didymodactylos carnosus]